MIRSALLKHYRIKEFMQFIRNVLMIVQQHGPDKLKIKAPYLALHQHHARLLKAHQQDTLSEITPRLAQLDARRDQAVICLRQVSEGYTHHFQEKLKVAGKRVGECIDRHGGRLYSLNYSEETAALKNLVRDLQTIPECVSAIQDMHLEEVVNEMQQANQTFEKLFIQRLEEFSQFEDRSIKELTQHTSEAYRTLVQHVQAHAILTPSEIYTSFINHLNKNIDHFNQTVERRRSGAEAEETETVVDEPVESPTV